MDSPDNNKKRSEIVDRVGSWIPWKIEPGNLSRDFWMPDQSCRVCYECDAQFTVFHRKHHCRICGRVFCSKCASNSIPNLADDECKTSREDWERIRVCSYCFKQWELQITVADNENAASRCSPRISPSSSATTSFVGSIPYSTGTYKHVSYASESGENTLQSDQICDAKSEEDQNVYRVKSGSSNSMEPFPDHFGPCTRSDYEEEDYSVWGSNLVPNQLLSDDRSNGTGNHVQINENDTPHDLDSNEIKYKADLQDLTLPPANEESNSSDVSGKKGEAADGLAPGVSDGVLQYDADVADFTSLDIEKNIVLWVPPDPENEVDDRDCECCTFDDNDDDDDDNADGAAGNWGYLQSSRSFGAMDLGNRERNIEEHRNAMKNLLGGHFRALISQLLQIENLPPCGGYGEESWFDIISSLSWDAATLLKPDMSKNGGMDPGIYVKVKCIASGHPSDSMVIKGVVCKKNVAHRRMTSKIDKARFLILEGALEYQRVANHLSSVDTLLQQEMDHLKMAVAKISAHHPNILLVEKSVSRFAQEYLLAKDISLVLNIKRPLLERIARCTGAQIVPSVDHITAQSVGYCDAFRVEKFFEEHGSAKQKGKKLTKTLMFFGGCPKPLGCTILLRGANGDELKKVKHVLHYGVFAAYHLALETSFLADEGASLPEVPLKSPIQVVLPENLSIPNTSISFVPDSCVSTPKDYLNPQYCVENVSDLRSESSMALGHVNRFDYECSESDCPTNRRPRVLRTEDDREPTGEQLVDENVDSCSFPLLEENSSLLLPSIQVSSEDNNNIDITNENNNEALTLKDACPSPSDDHQSILLSLTIRCELNGSVCERAHLFRIKYYGSYDKPLGRFLRDHLFDQNYQCHSCEMPSEGHIYCYTHRQGSVTISVRRFNDMVLSGENDGKIWMWHRCLRCPRIKGYPPTTKRVIMSDAAWGLSFGKFLELSFSNHAAATCVASCGHSLHRDCLRFYGCGRMIACFRYAPIYVHSVYLPPPKLEFSNDGQDWIQKEADEVLCRTESLFTEVVKSLSQILGKTQTYNGETDQRLIQQLTELEVMLRYDKQEFEEMLSHALLMETKSGQLAVDILELNRLRRQLIIYAYVWDQRLMQNSILSSNGRFQGKEKTEHSGENPSDIINTISTHNRSFSSCDSFLLKFKSDVTSVQEKDMDHTSSYVKNAKFSHSSSLKLSHENSKESLKTVRRVFSEGQFPIVDNLSDTLDAAWTGEILHVVVSPMGSVLEPSNSEEVENQGLWVPSDTVKSNGGVRIPYPSFYHSFDSATCPEKFNKINSYNPIHILSFRELLNQNNARLLLPTNINDVVVPIYDDEPTSIISCALVSPDYCTQMLNEKPKDVLSPSSSSPIFRVSETLKNLTATGESVTPLVQSNGLHVRLSFSDESPIGKVKYTVICYYAKRFEELRQICCPSELDFIRSLSRCKKWGAQGGKSNVFFAKTLDERFIIKQVTKTELESFIKFAPCYFKYLSDSVNTGCPTCLAKILGIYQVTTKHLKGGKETKMDVLVMENLLYKQNIMRLYDLKGSSRSRYNPDLSGSNKVLLDQNLLEIMPTSPIFVSTQAKRLLERAVWNDTQFLASVDVMDYSLLVGVDEEKHELVLGVIDFMRQYTWDKHLETWVKASGILGGPKNSTPTVISPKQYKKRFRKAMSAYFLMVPDQWSSSPTPSHSDLL